MNERKIPETDKYYSAGAVIREGFLGDWIKSRKGFTDLLRTEKAVELFKPITKQGKYMSFRIKGQHILEVLKLIDAGELNL